MIPLLAKLHRGAASPTLVGMLEILLAARATFGSRHHQQSLKRYRVATADALTVATASQALTGLLDGAKFMQIACY